MTSWIHVVRTELQVPSASALHTAPHCRTLPTPCGEDSTQTGFQTTSVSSMSRELQVLPLMKSANIGAE